MIIHFFQYLAIFQENLMILPHNISVVPYGPKCKHSSFCSICHKLSEYCNLEITCWGKQELLVIQKTILFIGNSFTDFRQKSAVLPQNDQ
jgi:hypothetical protein